MRQSNIAPSYDDGVDFSAAGLYLIGLQTIVSVCACSLASILSCWVLPRAAISAVRTLAITSAVGFIGISQPVRIERVRGVDLVFNALRPAIPIYILVLITEQLVHTCVASDTKAGRWRRVVFQMLMFAMMVSGFLRANRPTSEYDCSFVLTSTSLLVIALLPPPASALSGPLCEPSTLFMAGERMLRAMLFSLLYVIHVYTSTPTRNSLSEMLLCVLRAASAAVWILGCHSVMLTFAPLQAVVALWRRFGNQQETFSTLASYSPLNTHRPPHEESPLPTFVISNDNTHDLGNITKLRHSDPPSPMTNMSDEGVPISAAMLSNLAIRSETKTDRTFPAFTFNDDSGDVVPGMPFSRSRLDELAATL